MTKKNKSDSEIGSLRREMRYYYAKRNLRWK